MPREGVRLVMVIFSEAPETQMCGSGEHLTKFRSVTGGVTGSGVLQLK